MLLMGHAVGKNAKLWNDLSTEVKSSKRMKYSENVPTTSTVNAKSLSPAMVSIIFDLFMKKFCK